MEGNEECNRCDKWLRCCRSAPQKRVQVSTGARLKPLMADCVVEFGRDGRPAEADGRLDAAAFHRNHESIWSVLQRYLAGKSGDVLEAGSGTGQHAVYFAGQSPDITWWPSDLNERHLASIAAWRAHAGFSNVRPPLKLDLTYSAWYEEMQSGGGPAALLAVLCANVIHIAPWRLTEGLFAGAARCLRSDGLLLLYGPFKRDGKHTALSNAVFDASLRESDSEWGVRDTVDLERLGQGNGLALREVVEMPANNLILVFARSNRK
jgi:SAM-dependent methyltransferase